ncbi:MAG: spore coat protein U domain-containing protein, partial [Candidatus Velthaea sp.]
LTTFTAGPFNLGTYDPLLAADTTSHQSMSLKCSGANASLTITIGGGNAGTRSDRFMTGPRAGTSQLFYNLFDGNVLWDPAHVVTVSIPGNPSTATAVPVTATIPAAVANGRNDVPAGAYTDSVLVTVNF